MEELLGNWADLLPALLCLLGAFIYLYSTDPDKKPGTLRFWFAASLPDLGPYVARNLTFLFQSLFGAGTSLRLPLMLRLELRDIVIGIELPVVMAGVVNLILPVSTNRTAAVLFSIPVFIVHLYYLTGIWLGAGIVSMAYPGDTPGTGYQEITNGVLSILVSLLVLGLVAAVSWIATRIRRKA
jgi:hypothetical protein